MSSHQDNNLRVWQFLYNIITTAVITSDIVKLDDKQKRNKQYISTDKEKHKNQYKKFKYQQKVYRTKF